MVATIDFTTKNADNWFWTTEPSLTVLVANQQYQLPDPCFENSLTVTLNGQVLDRDSDNGFTVLSSTVFELKEPKQTWQVLQVGYLKRTL